MEERDGGTLRSPPFPPNLASQLPLDITQPNLPHMSHSHNPLSPPPRLHARACMIITRYGPRPSHPRFGGLIPPSHCLHWIRGEFVGRSGHTISAEFPLPAAAALAYEDRRWRLPSPLAPGPRGTPGPKPSPRASVSETASVMRRTRGRPHTWRPNQPTQQVAGPGG